MRSTHRDATGPRPAAEAERLAETRAGVPWRRWGPYLAERQWGTVREDYSADGDAWGSFTHDDARRRAYRWGEDGLLGISDDEQRLCLAVCLWNGQDPILKERLFGLSNPEGNHGEDVKELYFHLDAVPSSSLLRAAYLYPQRAFPYRDLVEESRRRAADDPEYELLDTGILDDDRFFDVQVTYAKDGPARLLMELRATNLGPDEAPLHLLPTIWFRNTWSWGPLENAARPVLSREADGPIVADHPTLGRLLLAADADGAPIEWLFTENEFAPVDGGRAPGKDAFHRYLVDGDGAAISDVPHGTKAAAHASWVVPAGASVRIRVALVADGDGPPTALLRDADRIITSRIAEADAFYAALHRSTMTPEERLVQRQALAGMLWNLKYYELDVARWRAGDVMRPPPGHAATRNADWATLRITRVLSVPDGWEYPWFAAWDLAFHTVTLALVDPDRAKEQLLALYEERALHPNGQVPAYEWEFSDLNPPVQAWAALRIYRREKVMAGRGDRAFLERMLHALTLEFGWWVNRRDRGGRNLFEGGFLGLDNISVLDRSVLEATGRSLDQADASGWLALMALGLTEISLELALDEPVYLDLAKHFLGRFVAIGEALGTLGGEGLWDPDERFFFDLLRIPGQDPTRIKAFSVVGLVPLFATRVLDRSLLDRLPGFESYLDELAREHPRFFGECDCFGSSDPRGSRLLSLVDEHRLVPILERLLDEDRFWSDHGVRSVSRRHRERELPVDVTIDGVTSRVEYEPGESTIRVKGGNSNWRGPIWVQMNYLLVHALRQYGRYHGDALQHPYPAPDGPPTDLRAVAVDLARRVVSLYMPGSTGTRPAMGTDRRWVDHPAFRDRLQFFEYFHGESGAGLGASHQTGWTALLANLLDELHRPGAEGHP